MIDIEKLKQAALEYKAEGIAQTVNPSAVLELITRLEAAELANDSAANIINELESTVEIIDKGQSRQEEKLRDKFAMAALSGLISNQRFTPEQAGELAPSAYAIADAMLLARGEK